MISDEDYQVRPDDFRKAWPHALARALQAALELTKDIDAATAKLETARGEVMELVRAAPVMLAGAKSKLQDVADLCVGDIKFASEVIREEIIRSQFEFQKHLADQQTQFLAEFKQQRQELHELRASHEKKLEELEAAKNNFEKDKHKFEIEKLGFNKMSLLKRVFFKA